MQRCRSGLKTRPLHSLSLEAPWSQRRRNRCRRLRCRSQQRHRKSSSSGSPRRTSRARTFTNNHQGSGWCACMQRAAPRACGQAMDCASRRRTRLYSTARQRAVTPHPNLDSLYMPSPIISWTVKCGAQKDCGHPHGAAHGVAGELVACELPGREKRRNEPRSKSYGAKRVGRGEG